MKLEKYILMLLIKIIISIIHLKKDVINTQIIFFTVLTEFRDDLARHMKKMRSIVLLDIIPFIGLAYLKILQ